MWTAMPSQTLSVALDHHKAGRLGEAERLYRQVLAAHPRHPDALHLLGVLLDVAGNSEQGRLLIDRAIGEQPRSAVFHNNLAVVLLKQGKWEEAAHTARRAADLQPGYVEPLTHLARALIELDRNAEAADVLAAALQGDPQNVMALFNHARVLCRLGRLEESIDACQRALKLHPEMVEAWCNLGLALNLAGRRPQAAAAFRQALALRPDFGPAHYQLAGVLWLLGELDEAEVQARAAFLIDPHQPLSLTTLGNIYKDQGRIAEAVAAFRRALAMAPGSYETYGALLYTLQFDPAQTPRSLFVEHALWELLQARPVFIGGRRHANDRHPDRRLRIGYVSPNFRNQAECFFTVPLLEAHDPAQVEIYCYSSALRVDAVTERLKARADVWRNTAGMSDDALDGIIGADQIDLLVDLTMHMGEGRPLLFARKPAPVQVSWLAYPGTTGLTTIDYRLTDALLDPPGVTDAFYSESLWRLPDTSLCYHPLTTEPPVSDLPALSTGHVTFGSLNNFSKANDQTLRLWASALGATPRSRMIVLAPRGTHRDRFLSIAKTAGVSADRIEFVERSPRPDYLRLFHRIDVVLDTWPYSGETTTLDGLWMGVPLVTLAGQTTPSRAGLMILTQLALSDLVARTPEQYAQIASGLAGDLPRLAYLRQSLRSRLTQSPLMNARRFAANVEGAYRQMWRRWTRGQAAV